MYEVKNFIVYFANLVKSLFNLIHITKHVLSQGTFSNAMAMLMARNFCPIRCIVQEFDLTLGVLWLKSQI
jgi:hypothetical protein